MLNISILSIGDELCIGQVVNTNASWLANQLSYIGCNIYTIVNIPDDLDFIKSEIARLSEISDFIILTGGLGPTLDDITKIALIQYFDDVLVQNQDLFSSLKVFFTKRGLPFTERNQQQALVPSKCKLLSNSIGTAPGMLFEYNRKYLVSLPGVPFEMKQISIEHLIPFIKQLILSRNDTVRLFKSYHTSGIAESLLADKLDINQEILDKYSIAFLPSPDGVKLRFGTSADNFDQAQNMLKKLENQLIPKIKDYLISAEGKGLMEVTANLLIVNNQTLSVAESCTGGLLGSLITAIPGSSKFFMGGIIAYDNEVKTNNLAVKIETLKQFGAVSRETAIEMAENARKLLNTDFAISITGIAGPDGGTDEKPVGTIWVGLSSHKETIAKKYMFGATRELNRTRAIYSALNLLYQKLK